MFGEDPDEVAAEDEDFAFGSDDDDGSDQLDLDRAADADGPMVSIEDDDDDEEEWEDEYSDGWAADEQVSDEEAADEIEEFFLPGLTEASTDTGSEEAGLDGGSAQEADADPWAEPASTNDEQPDFALPPTEEDEGSGSLLDEESEHHEEDHDLGLAFATDGLNEPGDGEEADDDVFADSDPHDGEDEGGEFAFVLGREGEDQQEREAAPGVASDTDGDGGMGAEMVRLFRDHIITRSPSGAYRFGLRDGDRLRDVHDFDTRGDIAAAYEAFVRVKIAEGFIPQVHLAEALDPEQEFESLAADQVRAATQAALGGG